MDEYVNIAAYRFAALHDLQPLRARLLAYAKERDLCGTILISPEGINLFVAGSSAGIAALLDELRAIPGLEDLTPKYSYSARRPFRRMLVRIKREIIAFGMPEIAPASYTSKKISPLELKAWLDSGRAVTLLDTRNDYETKLGTFDDALTLEIDHFRRFPAAVAGLPETLKKAPVVMFCTGGIRCEKAGPLMERLGYEHVWQLDGGILKYFEVCGGAHYHGECFVFDQRVGVDPALAETDSTQCFRCQNPLTTLDREDPRFRPGESCPACYKTPEERAAQTLATRNAAIRAVVDPLPGKAPYENHRPFNISAAYDGLTLIDALAGMFAHLPRSHWEDLFRDDRILNADAVPVAPQRTVRAGERYLRRDPETTEPDVNATIRILYEDEDLVVVDKPAPLPLHPCGRFNRNTLQSILNVAYAPQKLRPAHRLDANTTGVVIFARSQRVAGIVQPQFASGEAEKRYFAHVQGSPSADRFTSDMPIAAVPTRHGLRDVDECGLPAKTEFTVLRRDADGTALLEVRPLTGRTNQIRAHLWHLGMPILGDRAYSTVGELGETQTHALDDPPLRLHASRITIRHPRTGTPATFESPAPSWLGD